MEKNHNSWLFEKDIKQHSPKREQKNLIKVFVPRTRRVQTTLITQGKYLDSCDGSKLIIFNNFNNFHSFLNYIWYLTVLITPSLQLLCYASLNYKDHLHSCGPGLSSPYIWLS